MRCLLFVVNDVASMKPEQSTVDVIRAAAQSHEVWVASLHHLSAAPDGVYASARPWSAHQTDPKDLHTVTPQRRPLASWEGVWIRTNPGRLVGPRSDWLELLTQAEEQGVVIRNRPQALVRAGTKTFLSRLPAETIPRSWSGADLDELQHYLHGLGGPGVIKPASGTQGSGVAKVYANCSESTARMIEVLRQGPAILQEYLPEAPDGDTRIHLVDGRVLMRGGRPCAVRRRPQPGAWKSNVALGATPMRADVTPSQWHLCETVGPLLASMGLWHVGLDLVGPRIVEVNVFSPGGLADASRFEGQDFTSALLEAFVQLDSDPRSA
ncbi:MAG: hypothetical protein ACON5B_04900 [Myxococcota bacterium]